MDAKTDTPLAAPTTLPDMYTKLNATRSYIYAVARACDAGHVSRRDCAGAILYASDRAVEVTMDAMQSLGGNGYINEYPVARMLRDARLYTVGAGTQEIRRMLIGRTFNEGKCQLLGLGPMPDSGQSRQRIGLIAVLSLPPSLLYLL